MVQSAFGPFGLGARLRRSNREDDCKAFAPPDIWIREASSRWIEHVSKLGSGADIVLWRSSARYLIQKIRPGDLIAFVVKGVIVGVAVHAYSLSLSQADAWEEFGLGLGVNTYDELLLRIALQQRGIDPAIPRILTCRVNTDFRQLDPASSLFLGDLPKAGNGGLLCSIASDLGQRILVQWQASKLHLEELHEGESSAISRPDLKSPIFWTRPGQKRFKGKTIENYSGCCVVSDQSALPGLIAAHIVPFVLSGDHDLTNALLLRADLHLLFDQGYWTISRDGCVQFSCKMRKDYPNSSYPTEFQDKRLQALTTARVAPSWKALNWHRTEVYLDRHSSRF